MLHADFSLGAECRGYSVVRDGAALIVVASPVVEHRLQGTAQQSQHTGLVAPWHVDSSQITRDGNHVPCIGRQHLNHGPPGKSKNFHF